MKNVASHRIVADTDTIEVENAMQLTLHDNAMQRWESSKLVNSGEFTGGNTHMADALNRAERAASPRNKPR